MQLSAPLVGIQRCLLAADNKIHPVSRCVGLCG